MDSGISEIIGHAVGIGVFLTLAFNFMWEVLPDNVLSRIDFKPFNCVYCWLGWWGMLIGFVDGLGIINAIAFAGFVVVAGTATQRTIF